MLIYKFDHDYLEVQTDSRQKIDIRDDGDVFAVYVNEVLQVPFNYTAVRKLSERSNKKEIEAEIIRLWKIFIEKEN